MLARYWMPIMGVLLGSGIELQAQEGGGDALQSTANRVYQAARVAACQMSQKAYIFVDRALEKEEEFQDPTAGLSTCPQSLDETQGFLLLSFGKAFILLGEETNAHKREWWGKFGEACFQLGEQRARQAAPASSSISTEKYSLLPYLLVESLEPPEKPLEDDDRETPESPLTSPLLPATSGAFSPLNQDPDSWPSKASPPLIEDLDPLPPLFQTKGWSQEGWICMGLGLITSNVLYAALQVDPQLRQALPRWKDQVSARLYAYSPKMRNLILRAMDGLPLLCSVLGNTALGFGIGYGIHKAYGAWRLLNLPQKPQ